MPQFTDVSDPNKWYYAAVEWVAKVGLMRGTGSGKFEPDKPITRAEMAVILKSFYDLNNSISSEKLPLRSAEQVDLTIFNHADMRSPDYKDGEQVKDMRRLFHKQVIVDNETRLDVETIKVPGFIGISDEEKVKDPQNNTVSGYEDIVKFLDKYGLLICTYTYHKDRYGKAIDLRSRPSEDDLMEIVIKNEGHHSGAILPALRVNGVKAFASFNEPDMYHEGMYGHKGFIAVAQRLVFPEFVNPEQAQGYTDSIICWMALINPFVNFASDFNGGDPTGVRNRASLKEFLKNCALASLGSQQAIDFLNRSENQTYCAEFMYVSLNTPVYPFNKQGLTLLLDGDEAKAVKILQLQESQNSKRENILSRESENPQFKAFNIQMPVVPADLPPLDVLMTKNGRTIDPKSIPFPPFKLSQLLRRSFRTLLSRQENVNDIKKVEAQVKLLGYLEPLIFQLLRLGNSPNDPKVIAVRKLINSVKEKLQRRYNSYEEFDIAVNQIMKELDALVGEGDLTYFVPPRMYIDLGQNDGDRNLPQGWGFKLETVGALISRTAVK
jgi:S-layer homology domain